MEGHSSPQLFTALHGMGLRYKTLEDGERQVVNFIFPGDFIGMQAAILGEMKHSVEATTAMTLCVFDRKEIWQLYKTEPERGFSLTWLAAIEEHFLGEALATVGQRSAKERVAWALLRIHRRLSSLNLNHAKSVPLPYRQRDIADAVGLSLVHTNKTLAALREQQLASWVGSHLIIADDAKLAQVAGLDPESETPRRPLM
ncbi:MAG: Crp/Fnr family transcriptional regulator [Paracoccaceae bacterium]